MAEGRAMVVTYHSISRGAPPLRTAPEHLEAQLDLLEASGFAIVPLTTVVEHLEQRRPFERPTATLTFDDGYRDFLDAALPILTARELPSTLFVTALTDRTGLASGSGGPLLPLSSLAALADQGVAIGAHSIDHADLTFLEPGALDQELRECRRILEAATERCVRSR